MTFIPGTGTPVKIKKEEPIEIKPSNSPEIFTALNVKELKNPKEPEEYEKDVWYLKLKYWMIIGCSLSVLFAILAVLNYRFLFLLPLGPYTAYLSWHIRKKILKYAKKMEAFPN